MASIFSRIVTGEIPSAKVYEDEHTLAFMDINPASRGHTLIICKEEYPGLLDVPPRLVEAVARTTQRVARAIMTTLQPDGLNIVQNNGAAAGQVVFHYHIHIVPRWKGDQVSPFSRQGKADPQELQELATMIGNNMH
ncbi:MAG: HIT family protein [Chloroflexaceae bacterium]|nr:HIT family protein [Chloroflexaceae bacterium]